MLCWSLQRSCTVEPVTAELGISQEGVWGGTEGEDKPVSSGFLFSAGFYDVSALSLRSTQDFEGHVGLAQADGVERRTDLAAVLPSVLLSHSLKRHRGPFNGRSALVGT